MPNDELLNAEEFMFGKSRKSKAASAETGSCVSKVNRLFDERAGRTLGGRQ
jgi:hypothetical protein